MKINDIVLSEQPMNAQQLAAAQAAAAGRPVAPTAVPSSGTGLAGNNPTNLQKKTKKVKTSKVQPKKPVDAMAGANAGDQQTSNYTGAVQKSPEPAPEVDPSLDPYDPAKDTNVTQVADPGGTTAELDRLKQLAIGGQQPAAQAAQPAPAAEPAAAGQRPGGIAFNQDAGAISGQAAQPAAGQRPGGIAFNQDAGAISGQAAQPAAPAQAAQPAPMKTAQDFAGTPETNPDTGLSTAPKPVTTPSGAKTNITTGSDDEMAWRSKQTGIVDVTKYPGPGNWDPKTGRTKQDPNKPGFFDRLFGKKQAPAVASGPQGQAAQPMVPSNFAESNSEIDRIKKLSGLK